MIRPDDYVGYQCSSNRLKHMTLEEHAIRIGYIHTNLAALESSLRFFMLKLRGGVFNVPKPGDADAPLNWMTKWVSLGDLINKYNGELTTDERANFAITQEATDIRDALAHGRLHSPEFSLPWTLVKFGRQKSGRVPIMLNLTMTMDWLDRAYKLVGDDKNKVDACCKERGYSISAPISR
jgi:hypothetical protein